MIIPFLVRMRGRIPDGSLDIEGSGLRVGATRWEVIRRIVIPFAKSGIVGAVILGLGRALETMAVTFVIKLRKPEASWPGHVHTPRLAN